MEINHNFPAAGIPLLIGIAGYQAGYIRWNQDDGVLIELRKCFSAWDGYDEQDLILEPGTDPVTIDVALLDFVTSLPAHAAAIAADKRPEVEWISGTNDAIEQGYVVGALEETVLVEHDITPELFAEFLSKRHAASEIYIDERGYSEWNRNPIHPEDNLITVAELFAEGSLVEGWRCPALDQ
jgi:hypothetical protein